jgi:hypothetical protein
MHLTEIAGGEEHGLDLAVQEAQIAYPLVPQTRQALGGRDGGCEHAEGQVEWEQIPPNASATTAIRRTVRCRSGCINPTAADSSSILPHSLHQLPEKTSVSDSFRCTFEHHSIAIVTPKSGQKI